MGYISGYAALHRQLSARDIISLSAIFDSYLRHHLLQ
jgi:hypothetical protein